VQASERLKKGAFARIAIAALLLSAASLQAFGQSSWLDEMATIDAQTQLLKKREELRTQLEKTTSGTLAALPSVISIIVVDGRPQTQLHFPSGRVSYAAVGAMIAPNVRVATISEQGVEVAIAQGKTTRSVPLTFATLQSRFPQQYGAGGEDLSKNASYQASMLPEPPRVQMVPASPLPPGMLPQPGNALAPGR
jgi:hypothetical protein